MINEHSIDNIIYLKMPEIIEFTGPQESIK